MSWEDVPQSAGVKAAGVRCALKTISGGHVRLFVSPSPAILEALGWEAADRIGLALGHGKDAGRVRLSVRSGGGGTLRKLGRSKAGLVVALDPGAPLNAITAESHPCPHELEDGALMLTLPNAWWEAAAEAERAAQLEEAA